MFADADRGLFTHRQRPRQGPVGGERHPQQQHEQPRAHPTGEQTAQQQPRDGRQIFLLVHEHDREQDQHVHRAHVNQNLGRCHKAGIEQQVQARHPQKHAAQQEGGINNVGEQHHPQGSHHHDGGQNQEAELLNGGSERHQDWAPWSAAVGLAAVGLLAVCSVVVAAGGWARVASTCSGKRPARGALAGTPWGSITPLGR